MKTTLWATATPHAAGYREALAAEVSARLPTVRIVDVREPDEWGGPLGHIPGAELVPLAGVSAAAASWDPHGELVLVCRSGGRSGRAAALLAQAGFTRVISLRGGMQAWNEDRTCTPAIGAADAAGSGA